jgi:hypothetical protein
VPKQGKYNQGATDGVVFLNTILAIWSDTLKDGKLLLYLVSFRNTRNECGCVYNTYLFITGIEVIVCSLW